MITWDKVLQRVRTTTHERSEHPRHKGDINSSSDLVVLADGSFLVVRHNNLADAKALLAAQKVAERRISELLGHPR